MVYIKGLKFRGFKSFRKAEAEFPNGYICLAGPNGSGKSNVTDGIRFALGEMNLKALRAKRVSELVNTSCKYAEVTLYIDGEKQMEIKRAINPDGKAFYRVNGKRTTRTNVIEELRQYGMEAGSHNIIAQGQVQKIVEMNAKERRQIIDNVAGVSEFDQKKAEALSELSVVEQKINEANIILGERTANLSELEREKEQAVAYLDAQMNFKKAKASIINLEHAKLSASFENNVKKCAEAKGEMEELEKQSAVLSKRMEELEASKKKVIEKISASGSREATLEQINEAKVMIERKRAKVSEKSTELSYLEGSAKSAEKKLIEAKKQYRDLEEERKELSFKLEALGKERKELEQKCYAENVGQKEALAERLEILSAKIVSLKEQKARVEAEIASKENAIAGKKAEKEKFSFLLEESKESKHEGEKEVLEKEAASCQAALDRLFEQEKQLNKELIELEKKLLSTKEQIASLRANIMPSSAGAALKFVEEIRARGEKSIFGTVASLIAFEPKYAQAIEAAVGPRLNYVVVEDIDTAISVIQKLKAQKAGRCTFIPLDILISKESSMEAQHARKAQGCFGFLLDFVKYDPQYKNAMEYAFSDTLLFDNVQNAKKAGAGKARMVTLDGELFERSGVISGGFQKGSLLSKSALDKLEKEAEEIEAKRKKIYSDLYSIREEMASKRKEKADAEVKLHAIRIEMESDKARQENAKKIKNAVLEAEKEIAALESEVLALKAKLSDMAEGIEQACQEHAKVKKELDLAQQNEKKMDSELQKKLREISASYATIQEKLSAKQEQAAKLQHEISALEKEEKEKRELASECKKSICSLEKEIASAESELKEKEKRLAEISSSTKKLMDELSELEQQIRDIGAQLGKIKALLERKGRELVTLDANKQIIQEKLSDLKVELEAYKGIPIIEASREELEELVRSNQSKMDALGNVNLKAPELYEQKKKEIDEVKAKVESLSNEKNAVLRMIEEIDARKREIFLSTFTSINENFKKLFSFAFKEGEATLVIDKPSSPFEGGLHVKIRENNKDKYLDSMSGGEKALLALIFIFSIQMHKAAPFYILDEADSALDKENSKKLTDLIRQLSGKTQFIVVTHNDTVIANADVALGVTKTEEGSKIVGVQLTSSASISGAGGAAQSPKR